MTTANFTTVTFSACGRSSVNTTHQCEKVLTADSQRRGHDQLQRLPG